jgi:hypothetical protein
MEELGDIDTALAMLIFGDEGLGLGEARGYLLLAEAGARASIPQAFENCRVFVGMD